MKMSLSDNETESNGLFNSHKPNILTNGSCLAEKGELKSVLIGD